MPEYLAPGVYVEEVSFRSKSIEGVSTSTAGFVGPTRFGPTDGVPELVTSFSDFERIYGGLDELEFVDTGESVNYLAQGVRAFFDNGGQRLYVQRIFEPLDAQAGEQLSAAQIPLSAYASSTILDQSTSPPSGGILLRARYPGGSQDDPTRSLGITFTIHATKSVLAGVPHDPTDPNSPKDPALRGVNQYDLVWISQGASPPGPGEVYWADKFFDTSQTPNVWSWRFQPESGTALELSNLDPLTDQVRIVTVGVAINYPGAFPRSDSYQNLTFHPDHPNSLSKFFAEELNSRSLALTVPLVFDPDGDFTNGPTIARIMMTQPRSAVETGRLQKLLPGVTALSILDTIGQDRLADTDRQLTVSLGSGTGPNDGGGNDGNRPTPARYEGDDTDPKRKTGLKALEDVTDISIVAAPGYSARNDADPNAGDKILQVALTLIGHCERMRYRIAVLDSTDGQDLTEVREDRAQMDSTYAAFYYPWIRIIDPVTQEEINIPPSGSVAGLYADNDILYGVHKAPANMVVQDAIRFEVMLNKAQQDVLNPEGINCFRFFEDRGYRLWGARTISSDPEWKYVNLRRYFAYLEHSIDKGTQWAVFDVNSEPLWTNVRTTIEQFLNNEWSNGRLMGNKPEEAYFVRCDRTTMTQNDLDNGRLVCLIGVAVTRPAEFVIFRIGQWVQAQS